MNGNHSRRPEDLPRIPGHEAVGTVVEVGAAVTTLSAGQRVMSYFYLFCDDCDLCRLAHEPLCRRLRGQVGVAADGGYAEYLALPARNFLPVPEGVSVVDATAIPDAIATPFHVSRRAAIVPGDTVLVVGAAGGVGIHMVQMAREFGGAVIAIDRGTHKLKAVSEFGALAALDADTPDLSDCVRAVAPGGVGVAIDLVGTAQTLGACLEALGPRGRLVLLTTFPGVVSIIGSRYASRWEVAQAARLVAARHLACNRNKRSLVLDLKQAAGRGALLRLAATADVILHNFRPGPAARLGLEYEAFRAVNPRLVYCATYGFRARGPYGDKPAYDDVIQAAAGLASLQAPLVGEPRYIPTIVADKTSSLAVLSAVLSALFHRERTGEGQAIEVPMFETVVAYVMVEHLYGETFVPPLETAGYKRILNRWRRPFRTRDGYLAVVPYTDADWRAFFAVAGRPDLLADPRFTTLESRLANIEVLYEELSKIVATRSSAEGLRALDRAGVPATIVNTLQTLLTDPQLEATGFWQIVDPPSEGTLRLPAIPTTYSRAPGAIPPPPPRPADPSPA